MDDLKLFAKIKNKIEFLVQTVHIFSEDIDIQLRIRKCGILILERGKVVKTYGIRLPDGKDMKNMNDQTERMKEKFSREYLRRVRLILRSNFNGRNKVMTVNNRAVPVMRYGTGILKWNTDELKSLDRTNRRFMTMHGALHPKMMLIGYILIEKWEEGD